MASQGNPNPGRSRRDPWPFPTPGLEFLPQMRGVMLPEVAAVGIWSLHWGLEGILAPSPAPKPPDPKPTGTRDGCAHLAVGPASCRHRRELSTSPPSTLGPLSPNLSGHKATNLQTTRVSAFSLIFFFPFPYREQPAGPGFYLVRFPWGCSAGAAPSQLKEGSCVCMGRVCASPLAPCHRIRPRPSKVTGEPAGCAGPSAK